MTGMQSGQGDMVSLINNKILVEQVQDKYDLVQSVDLGPRVKVDVIDVAALAAVITDFAKDYSLCHYMCWWWSAVFFRTIVSAFDLDAAVKRGPLYKDRARAGKFTFINEECELVLPTADEHDRVAAEFASAGTSGSMVELMNEEDMRDDARKMTEKRWQEPQQSNVKGMVAKFHIARLQCRELIRAKVDAKIKERDKVPDLERTLEEYRERERELRRELENLRGLQISSS